MNLSTATSDEIPPRPSLNSPDTSANSNLTAVPGKTDRETALPHHDQLDNMTLEELGKTRCLCEW